MDYKINLNKTSETHHLKNKACFLSHFFFCWELTVLYRKWKRKLGDEELQTPLKDQESKKLVDRLETFWEGERLFSKNPSLLKALIKAFGAENLLYGLILGIADPLITVLQPFYLAKLLDCLASRQETSRKETYIYASIVIALSFLRACVLNFFLLEMSVMGTKIRVASSSLCYKKVLQLKKSTIRRISLGQILTLLTKDVEVFDLAFRFLHLIWIGVLKIPIVICFLLLVFDSSTTSGIGVIVLAFLIQVYTMKKIAVSKKSSSLETDHRITLMSSIIYKNQEIKVNKWETLFETSIKNNRKKEIKHISKTIWFSLINASLDMYISTVSILVCILVAVLGNVALKSYYIFALTNMYQILGLSVGIAGYGLSYMPDIANSIRRMQEFLLMDNKKTESHHKCVLTSSVDLQNNEGGVSIKNVNVKWDPASLLNTLNDVNIVAQPSELIAIVGSAGSGKSTLLQTILKEVDANKGDVFVGGTVSYASQEPWIFPATFKQNILFGEEMDERKYKKVIKICALEQDLVLMSHGDNTLVGERGVKLSGGQKARINLARAIYRDADIYLLDDPLSAVDSHVATHMFNECILKYLQNKCVVLVTHQVQYLENVDRVYVMNKGTVISSGKYCDLRDLIGKSVETNNNKRTFETNDINLKNYELPKEVVEFSGSTTVSPFKIYLLSHRRWITACVCFFLLTCADVLVCGSSYFLSIWVNEKGGTSFEYNDDAYNLSIYSSFVIVTIVIVYVSFAVLRKHCIMASKSLHNLLFDKVLAGSMNFFNEHSSGRILSRFSRDIGIIDEQIPRILFEIVRTLVTIIGASVMIVIADYWMIFPTLLTYALLYIYVLIFVPTLNYLKRIEKTRTSPICTHISASLQGSDTIRALNRQNLVLEEFYNYQNLHSAVYYLHQAVYFAFGFWSDFTSAAYSAIVIVCLLVFHNVSSIGILGLVITQSLMLLDNCQYATKLWGTLQPLMTSVERVVKYTDLTTEEDEGSFIPPDSWPQKGRIIFNSVSMRYSPEKPMVLKGISFIIEPGEKIGIVGRTGAGKTSLISVLFRLFDFEGNVYIDGIDTKTLPLSVLRSKITIISQNPFLVTGTVRTNLDPFNEFDDSQLWRALEDVALKTFIASLPSGLQNELLEEGSNFSVGQRQLLCLARVILKNSKIIILDEPTANLDLKTDQLIQSTLKKKFKNSTVLTIAHRLDTIMDSDKILVVDSGSVVEFGSPEELSSHSGGYFHKYCESK